MPLEGDAQGLVAYPMAKKGINLRVMRQALGPEEALRTSNLFWRDGIEKRTGYQKLDNDKVSGDNPINGLHRFYFGTVSRQIIASSGTEVRFLNAGTWDLIKSGLTNNAPVLFETWGSQDKVYMGNGEDAPFKWDGTSESAITNLTEEVIQFLSYQDRLLFIATDKPGELGWSNSFDDTAWNFAFTISVGGDGETGVAPDTALHGMIIHAAQVSEAGVKAKVLLAGSNGMYIFSGTSLVTPSTNAASDYSIENLATNIGCISPLTMKWTPKGTVYLGTDKQVYILPFDSLTPLPIGQKIISSQEGRVEGLEAIPATQMPTVSAVYHEGYYKLSIPAKNGSFNSVQYWLDMDRMEIDENKYFGPWYGPMAGMRFRAQTVQSGPGDNGEWIGGEADGSVGGFVYNAGISGSFLDDGETIPIEYQTFFHSLSQNIFLDKVIDRLELEISSESVTINVDFLDTIGKISESLLVGIIQDAIFWNQQNWDTFNWASLSSVRVKLSPKTNIKTRYLSIVIKVTSLTSFRLFDIGANFEEQSVPFGVV